MVDRPVHVPRGFASTSNVGDVFDNKIKENHEIEQYFWTSGVVRKLLDATQYAYTECCCFTTPSMAHAYHEAGREQTLLDIDTRFDYLPRFERFDILDPHTPEGAGKFQVLVIDPPFFGITTQQLVDATDRVTRGDHSTKIIIAYLVRYERALLTAFAKYGISETTTPLEYVGIKPNKWKNFALYANVDLPGIRRIPGKQNYKGRSGRHVKP